MQILDWLVLIVFVLGMLGIGFFYSKKNKDTEDYLLGGRKMNPNSIGISLFATLLSALSYLTYPAEMIQHGPAVFAGVLSFPFVYFIISRYLIPKIRKYQVTSAYEILEIRFDLKIRLFATSMFLILRLLWLATIIYVTVDIAFVSVLHINKFYIPIIEVIITLITIIYTTSGGLKAVVVTDVIQSIVFLGAAILTIIIIGYKLHSFNQIIPTSRPFFWDDFKLGFDPKVRTTIGNGALVLFIWYICTNGADQMAIQRYLASKDVSSAKKTIRIALYSNTLAYILLALVGLAILAFYTNQGVIKDGELITNSFANTLFPRFIVSELPAGISGLVIAGILSASMSSMSAGINSISSVLFEDIIKRFSKRLIEEKKSLKIVKGLSIITGIVVLILSIFVGMVSGNLFDVVMKVVNLFVGPLFVLFFMAFFLPISTSWGAFYGGIISVIVAIGIAFGGWFGITVMWIMPISLLVGIITGILFSIIIKK